MTWTVTELTGYIRELFEIDYRLQEVEVSGEISNFTHARSGHLYFTLKDGGAQLKCVMWKTAAQKLRFLPQEGDAIVAEGRISVYETSGVYQLYATRLTPAGRGDLTLAFERLKQQLEAEGLFAADRKQPIPRYPRKIGIVTSADAAALRDILHVLQRRYPVVEVLIAPALVQGDAAPPQIVRALQWLDGRYDIDSIILARGGGSIEDLWAFNDERVARAVYQAQHPIISGVGHETDFTIVDFVADLRAPTPSAAAEMATPDGEELSAALRGVRQKLQMDMDGRLQRAQWQVQALSRSLNHLSPRATLDNNRQRIDGLHGRLAQAIKRKLNEEQGRLALTQARLTGVSPLATLSRGYAIVRDANGRIIRHVETAVGDSIITIRVSDGEFEAQVSK